MLGGLSDMQDTPLFTQNSPRAAVVGNQQLAKPQPKSKDHPGNTEKNKDQNQVLEKSKIKTCPCGARREETLADSGDRLLCIPECLHQYPDYKNYPPPTQIFSFWNRNCVQFQFEALPPQTSNSRAVLAVCIILEVTEQRRKILKKISSLAFEPLALFKLAVKIVAIPLPAFGEALPVAKQGARLGFAVRKIASAVIMRKAGKGRLTGRLSLPQLLGTHSWQAHNVVGNHPHPHAWTLSPSREDLAGNAIFLEAGECAQDFRAAFGTGFNFV